MRIVIQVEDHRQVAGGAISIAAHAMSGTGSAIRNSGARGGELTIHDRIGAPRRVVGHWRIEDEEGTR